MVLKTNFPCISLSAEHASYQKPCLPVVFRFFRNYFDSAKYFLTLQSYYYHEVMQMSSHAERICFISSGSHLYGTIPTLVKKMNTFVQISSPSFQPCNRQASAILLVALRTHRRKKQC